ncbi:histone-lysine N-methyltransferase SETMAR [Nephila pilipes]|uniref:Histone-lysine N-methyltransferase SETMAR n=1 Tax=Nephila pilipes TaxID=299642 RepID=A0A8X6QZF7_NEPPI|nr:histone-lysine N-methyltransferase SETMAR [Nephila pilipes]
MDVNKEKIRYILLFFFNKGEYASQMAEIVNGVYGADTVTTNYVQFWFHCIFYVKEAPRTGRPIVKNVDEITEIFEVDWHDNARPHSSVTTPQKLRDLAPRNYHVFLEFGHFLSDKKLASREDCENRLLEFSANRDQDFYERGIMKLLLKWQQIIEQNGAYGPKSNNPKHVK